MPPVLHAGGHPACWLHTITDMKSGFLDKLLTRLDRVAPEEVQGYLLRLVREKGFFEQVFEALEEGVIICDPQGVISFINRAACGFFGLAQEETAGRRLDEAVRGLVWHPLKRGDSTSRDMQVFYPEQRWLNFYLRAISDDDDPGTDVLGAVMLIRDITQTRRIAEEQIESERMTALTVLAAGVAHEIGNPLNSLNIHLQVLEKKLKKSDPETWAKVSEQVEVARGEATRLDFIIRQFLGAVRPTEPSFELSDLNRVVEDAVNFLAPELNDRKIRTRLQLHEGLPLLRLDVAQMRQALYNLIRNAVQAMGTGGSLTIRTDLQDYEIRVTFTDTGKGIAPQVMASVHQPWFTTKEGGTGLGMLIVRRIVRDHGGELALESSEGKGTTVTISLPRGNRAVRFLDAGAEPAAPDVIDV